MISVEVGVRIHGVARERSSRDGNPRWRLRTSLGDYLTAPDAQVGYEVDPASWPGTWRVLHLDRQREVVGVT